VKKLIKMSIALAVVVTPAVALAEPRSIYASGVAKWGLCETTAASNVWHFTPCFWLWF